MKLPKINPTIRIVFGLVALTTSIILLASFVGLFPDHRTNELRSRRQFCESLALTFSTMANRTDLPTMENYFATIAERNDAVRTIGLRQTGGSPLLEVGDHFGTWTLSDDDRSTDTQISIPVFGKDEQWGTVEVQFDPLGANGIAGLLSRTEYALIAFVSVIGLVVFYIYLRVVLRHLNPSKVIPRRVREAFDSLAEGLLVLDKHERIVLANQSFRNATGQSMDDLLGKQANTLPFTNRDNNTVDHDSRPWQETRESGVPTKGRLLGLDSDQGHATFSVSCAPILDEKGSNRGTIASFEDVTQLEKKKNELTKMVEHLDASTAEIKRQNRELETLANQDSLTGCMNRRCFFQHFDAEFSKASSRRSPLSAFMVDIDNFKLINDNHGHAVGDEVLKIVAATLEESVRESGIVCRYGGEEFAILLPDTDISRAADVAETIRASLEAIEFPELSVTASIGVSAMCQSPGNPQDLLEQADKCLYVAKRNGRNQVVRWDEVPEGTEIDESQLSHVMDDDESTMQIPFHAVTALISALAYRDQETANHCRRVADLCVAVAEGLLPMKDCYTLEIAGLLHDIGKIGVPDSILLKPESLTKAEWQVMKMHERIGAELVAVSFACPDLDEIVVNYRIPFDSMGASKTETPIGARILAIVDAYDSMTTSHPYRPGMTKRSAIVELRRCAGDQFDPELVERLVHTLKVRGDELSSNPQQVSKAAALSIGLQIERLSIALDNRDTAGIGAIAARLEETANKHGAISVADKARSISMETQHDGDLYEIIRCTNELLDLCRSSQRSLLNADLQSTENK